MRRLLLAWPCIAAACNEPLDLGTDLVWATDNESGDLSAWSASPGTGGWYLDYGNPSVEISTEQAHSGRYSIKISATAAAPDPNVSSPSGGGLYKEGLFPQEAYYSVWYYVPQSYQTATLWTILKFEALPSSDAGAADGGQAGDTDASAGDAGDSGPTTPGVSQLLDVRIQSLPTGDMTFILVDHRKMYLASPMPNPPPHVPIARWFQLECFYRNAPDSTGHLTIWLDGTMIYDISRPMTANPAVYFTPCSLADKLTPSSMAIYVDDVAISWKRMTPQGVLKL